jgi:hypothetical protein
MNDEYRDLLIINNLQCKTVITAISVLEKCNVFFVTLRGPLSHAFGLMKRDASYFELFYIIFLYF